MRQLSTLLTRSQSFESVLLIKLWKIILIRDSPTSRWRRWLLHQRLWSVETHFQPQRHFVFAEAFAGGGTRDKRTSLDGFLVGVGWLGYQRSQPIQVHHMNRDAALRVGSCQQVVVGGDHHVMDLAPAHGDNVQCPGRLPSQHSKAVLRSGVYAVTIWCKQNISATTFIDVKTLLQHMLINKNGSITDNNFVFLQPKSEISENCLYWRQIYLLWLELFVIHHAAFRKNKEWKF
jgi:hypothetical protein